MELGGPLKSHNNKHGGAAARIGDYLGGKMYYENEVGHIRNQLRKICHLFSDPSTYLQGCMSNVFCSVER